MGLIVMTCRACGIELTRPIEQLDVLPERHEVDSGDAGSPTVQAGAWARDTGREAERLVVNPADALGLEAHPDRGRNNGCCGHDGLDGPNRRCASCHAEVATLRDDCWTPLELLFDPAVVRRARVEPVAPG